MYNTIFFKESTNFINTTSGLVTNYLRNYHNSYITNGITQMMPLSHWFLQNYTIILHSQFPHDEHWLALPAICQICIKTIITLGYSLFTILCIYCQIYIIWFLHPKEIGWRLYYIRSGLVMGLPLVYNILVSIDPYGIMLTDTQRRRPVR